MSSVRENERSQGKMQVHIKARELAVYTIRITKNEKVFVPEYFNTVTNQIISAALDIHLCLWEANNIRVESVEEKDTRRKYQQIAVAKCNRLLALIDIARPLFHLSSKRVKYWSKLIIEVRKLAVAWKASDHERYKHIGM